MPSLRLVAALVLLVTVPVGTQPAPSPDSDACVALRGVASPPWSVRSADYVQPPFTTFATGTSGPPITVDVPFCRVVGDIKPTADSDIRFEVWLPPHQTWNGKFAAAGSGGTRGAIESQRVMRLLARHYAAMSTDSGHRSSDVTWALGHRERIADFGYRAEHLATQAAQSLTQRFYGRAPQHSYFVGCSQGGHHGLMEAQRFPDDYDGVIAGTPVYDWAGEMTEQAWNVRALKQTPEGALSKRKLQLLHEAVVRACGGADGLVDDPRHCSFDPGSLKCRAVMITDCLTDTEIDAVRQMYGGPRTSSGQRLYPGLTRGGEGGWDRLWSNPQSLGGSWSEFYRFMAFQNPSWDLSMLDFDREPRVAEENVGSMLNATNADLSAFASRGRKLIVYHGWADDMVPAQTSVDYYDAVNAALGSQRVKAFYRLFMVPGMWHCSSGPDVFFQSEAARAIPLDPDRDLLVALEQWVEHGRAPDTFVTSHVTKDGSVTREHLVCAYPNVAVYRGSGDMSQANNWSCSSTVASPQPTDRKHATASNH